MKKKVKLFSTIASLCLAVALMAFGVWAATSSKYSVTSKVSFTSKDVMVTWNAKVVGGKVTNNVTAPAVVVNATTNPGAEHKAEPVNLGAQEFDTTTTEGLTITYTITCQNNGENVIRVTPAFKDTKKFATAQNVVVTYKMKNTTAGDFTPGDWAVQTIAKGETATWEVALRMENITQDVAEQNLDVSFVAERG